MFKWIQENLEPKKYDLHFNYVFFSYYDEDCENLKINGGKWAKIFNDLIENFTLPDGFKPKVGFGETGPQCNCRETDEAGQRLSADERRAGKSCRDRQPDYVKDYFVKVHQSVKESLTINKQLYVGGFFYWYFYQDMTNENNQTNAVLKKLLEAAKKKDW